MNIVPVPVKTVQDWQALATLVRDNGPQFIAPTENIPSGHATLIRSGFRFKQVRLNGAVVAYKVYQKE